MPRRKVAKRQIKPRQKKLNAMKRDELALEIESELFRRLRRRFTAGLDLTIEEDKRHRAYEYSLRQLIEETKEFNPELDRLQIIKKVAKEFIMPKRLAKVWRKKKS